MKPLIAALILALASPIVPTSALAQAPGKAATRPPRGLDLTAVWIGMSPEEAPAKYRNDRYPSPPPFTPEGERMSKHWGDPKNNLGVQCLPGGGAQGVMNAGFFFPIEIIQKDSQITIVAEMMSSVRRVYMDGKGHPEDLEKTWLGHSIGRWEKDTLVIDTVGGHAGPLNGSGATVLLMASDAEPRMPYSESLHLTERIRMLEGGKYLENEITFTDPVIYTKPFTLKRYWRRAPDLSMLEYVCTENPRPQDEGMVVPQMRSK